jgi:hypothetical protein
MSSNLPQITYMFGAGASAQVLPTIKGLPDRIKYVRDYIEKQYVFDEDETYSPIENVKFKRNDAKKYLLDGLDELYNVSCNHSTIDTYAKKLYISGGRSKVKELCFFLSLYFNIEQKIVGVDPRYDTFLISILDSTAYRFPNNLKFLTWNYDTQLEIAHTRISRINENNADGSIFNTELDRAIKHEFASVKINGNCNVMARFRDSYPIVQNILQENCDSSDLNFALAYGYIQLVNGQRIYDVDLNLNFAWYHDRSRLEKISELYNETEILVVIGYSFPFFNREVDRKIIRSMNKLRKIYIQDCYPENIISRFLSILPDWKDRDIQIIPVSDITEFFLPPEL